MLALDPQKEFTQYTRTFWTQGQSLPQDTIGAIWQTADCYLWLWTREGLARFDGSDFVTFSMDFVICVFLSANYVPYTTSVQHTLAKALAFLEKALPLEIEMGGEAAER